MMFIGFLCFVAGYLIGFGICAWITWRVVFANDKEVSS